MALNLYNIGLFKSRYKNWVNPVHIVLGGEFCNPYDAGWCQVSCGSGAVRHARTCQLLLRLDPRDSQACCMVWVLSVEFANYFFITR